MADANARGAARRSYETSDAPAGRILRVAAVLVAVVVVGQALVWALFYVVSRDLRAPLEPPSPRPAVSAPEPRLQIAPQADLERLRAREQRILGSYGWVDRDAGVVHIPIDRAMELLVKRSQGKPAPPPAEHNSGNRP